MGRGLFHARTAGQWPEGEEGLGRLWTVEVAVVGDRPGEGALLAPVVRVQVDDQVHPGRPQRVGEVLGHLVGVAAVREDRFDHDAVRRGGHDDADEARHRIDPARDELGASDELGDRGAALVGHHRHERVVVAEEQLVLLPGPVPAAMPPGRLGIGTGTVFLTRRAREARDVGPVDGVGARGVLVGRGDARFEQSVAEPLKGCQGCTVGIVLSQRPLEEVGRVLDLAVAQFVRAALPGDAAPRGAICPRRSGRPGRRGRPRGTRSGDPPTDNRACRRAGCARATGAAAPRGGGLLRGRRSRRRDRARRAALRCG